MGNTTILRGDQIEGIESSQNFVKNLGERNTAGWVKYNDGGSNPSRPIDGIGGTPTSGLDVTLSATNPLAGDKSFVFSKPASNCQGQGFSYDFAIDRASRAKVLKIEFDYLVDSGTFNAGSNTADSDLIVYIYDVDAGQLIEPSTFKLYANSTNITDRFSGYFQTSASSTNYRLIFHVATTNASAWSLKVDNVVVSPSKYVYGTPITDWVSYTPQLLGSITNPTIGPDGFVTGRWRRIGDSVEVRATASRGTSGGSNGSGYYYLTLPSGMVADLTKIPNRDNVGTSHVLDGGVLGYTGTAHIVSDGFKLSVALDQYGDLIRDNIPSAGWWTSAGVQYFSINATIPIQGWSSSVRMSDGYEGREILVGLIGGSAAGNNNVSQKITGMTLASYSKDTTASWDAANSRFIVPVSGFYSIVAHGYFVNAGGANSGINAILLHKNGSYLTDVARRDSISTENQNTWSFVSNSTPPVYLVAGDILEFYAYQNSGVTRQFNGSHFSIQRISSPQTIAMGEVVAARYTSSSGQSIPNATPTTINFNTKEYDTHNAVTTGTNWKFTAPVAGTYNVSSYLLYNSFTIPNNGDMNIAVHKNGPIYAELGRKILNGGGAFYISVGGTTDIKLNAGDTISIVAENYSGAARTLIASDVSVWVSIHKVS
jgi:hypothetical protein